MCATRRPRRAISVRGTVVPNPSGGAGPQGNGGGVRPPGESHGSERCRVPKRHPTPTSYAYAIESRGYRSRELPGGEKRRALGPCVLCAHLLGGFS